jgi:hypothetical protein
MGFRLIVELTIAEVVAAVASRGVAYVEFSFLF